VLLTVELLSDDEEPEEEEPVALLLSEEERPVGTKLLTMLESLVGLRRLDKRLLEDPCAAAQVAAAIKRRFRKSILVEIKRY